MNDKAIPVYFDKNDYSTMFVESPVDCSNSCEDESKTTNDSSCSNFSENNQFCESNDISQEDKTIKILITLYTNFMYINKIKHAFILYRFCRNC